MNFLIITLLGRKYNYNHGAFFRVWLFKHFLGNMDTIPKYSTTIPWGNDHLF